MADEGALPPSPEQLDRLADATGRAIDLEAGPEFDARAFVALECDATPRIAGPGGG